MLLLAVLLAAAAPLPASPQPAPAQQAEARELSRRSIVEFKAGDFEKALADITRAYELDPRPGFLYNLGQCHRALEHWKKAKFFFEGYLRELPQAPNRKLLKKLIAEADERLAEQARKEAAVQEALTAPAPSQTPVPIVISPSAPEQPVPAAAVFGRESPPAKPGRGGAIAGWTLVAVGLAAAAGGGAWNGLAWAGRPTNVAPTGAASPVYDQTQGQVDAFNGAMVAAPVVWGAGAALALAGAIVLLASH